MAGGVPESACYLGGFAGTAGTGAELLKETLGLNHRSEKLNPASPLPPQITWEGFSLKISSPSQLVFRAVH